ncbi:MAG: FTR1 family protein [Rhizobiales bacterium]|nr:FTR1 family protein [Hyphomicrobiales bacterium]MBI3673083.1 FTR1 family protein [Hyphomicrobiales bacterium]
MIGALIIVFREVIEAGLIIGIVAAATQRAPGSRLWIAGGAAGGIGGSILVAAFMGAIATGFGGFGQELLNSLILATAVVMLTWHNVWMARHGRSIADEMFLAGREVAEGRRPLLALAVVVGMAVLREGAEVALFLYGVAISDGGSGRALLAGGLMGLGLGALVSALTYYGLLRIPTRQLFLVTSWLIALLAAGMAAQAVSLLEQAGTVEFLGTIAWNSSALLSEKSIFGRILHTLVGYSEQPTVLQLATYLATLVAIFVLMRIFRPSGASPGNSAARAAAE